MLPSRVTIEGVYVTLAPLDPTHHADALWEGSGGPEHEALWAYMHSGPYPDREGFDAALQTKAASKDPLFFAIVERVSGRAIGHAAFMRIDPDNRTIEVGHVMYSPALQKTRAATEAIYLLARYVFEDLEYRRFEWKCNALNAASRRAALRLGFTFEGIFRQHMIVKGQNRDTAWFSMLDSEWPDRKREFERWLDASNFDADGQQKTRLAILV